MEIISSPKEMRSCSESQRKKGEIISFVPTMGFLHHGHQALIKEGRKKGDFLVVSIFVNPIQFGPKEDYNRYPRDFERDKKICEEGKVDVLFTPSGNDMYPPSFNTYVEVADLDQHLCGLSRPGHFKGVATVVTKLFHIVKPHKAFFGYKDYQQFLIIKKMVEDLDFDLEVIGVETVREEDGIAMSSRNLYLSEAQREMARVIPKAMEIAKTLYRESERSSSLLKKELYRFIGEETKEAARIDYIEISNRMNLEEVETIGDDSLMALAIWIDNTRLIDNFFFEGL